MVIGKRARPQMKYSLACAFLILTSSCLALETKPWFGDQYEFEFQSAFTYYRFHEVEGASVQLKNPSNTRVFLLDFGWTPSSQFDLQMEGEFAKNDHINWALRSTALQGRYQLLDDIAGDPVSFALGANMRGAPHHFLKDVGTPYASEFNLEVTASIGKEWSQEGMWTMRTYGFAAVGIANHGYPWTRELLVWQYNFQNTHRLSLFAEGDFGFGNKQHVDVKHFNGWAKFQHQSIDLGIAYGYKISFYGILSAAYMHRIFAHNFPEHVNFFTLSYCIPFSLF
jgi:hypothetical protein